MSSLRTIVARIRRTSQMYHQGDRATTIFLHAADEVQQLHTNVAVTITERRRTSARPSFRDKGQDGPRTKSHCRPIAHASRHANSPPRLVFPDEEPQHVCGSVSGENMKVTASCTMWPSPLRRVSMERSCSKVVRQHKAASRRTGRGGPVSFLPTLCLLCNSFFFFLATDT